LTEIPVVLRYNKSGRREVRMKIIATFIALIFCLPFLQGSACGEEKRFIAPTDKEGIQRVEVVATEYSFDPNYIVVRVNLPVEIKIRKEPSAVPHNFVLKAPEAGIDIHESLGTEPKLIMFTPAKPGKYSFYCDKKLLFFKSHRDRGMEGILEVTE
jgi:plastocyanin domain-containing protein